MRNYNPLLRSLQRIFPKLSLVGESFTTSHSALNAQERPARRALAARPISTAIQTGRFVPIRDARGSYADFMVFFLTVI